MWKPETNNKTLPTRLSPLEGHQKETQYPGRPKDTTRKGMWIGEDNDAETVSSGVFVRCNQVRNFMAVFFKYYWFLVVLLYYWGQIILMIDIFFLFVLSILKRLLNLVGKSSLATCLINHKHALVSLKTLLKLLLKPINID